MKFFVDTADIKAIKEVHAMGLIDGVTTNPSLIAKTGRKFETVIEEICQIVDGPISAEVVATDAPAMIAEGEKLAKIHKNIVVKIPLIEAGLVATKALSEQGIRTNVTLCFHSVQALLAAKAGATYISPFIGRLDDISTDGMQIIDEIRTIYDNYGYDTEILAASIRHPMHLKEAAIAGADVATVPPQLFQQFLKHPLTDIGLEKFLADFHASQK